MTFTEIGPLPMEQLHLAPVAHLSGQIKLPGSKSISNRTLLLAALAQGDTLVRDLLDADDIHHMFRLCEP